MHRRTGSGGSGGSGSGGSDDGGGFPSRRHSPHNWSDLVMFPEEMSDRIQGTRVGGSLASSLRTESGGMVVHFNNAGASPSPPGVLKAIGSHLALEATVGGYNAAERSKSDLNKVYESVVKLVNANHTDEIALMESCTVAWTKAFYAMAEAKANAPPITRADGTRVKERMILTCDAEYAANIVAMVKFVKDKNRQNQNVQNDAERIRWTVLTIPSKRTTVSNNGSSNGSKSTGVIDLKVLDDILAGRFRRSGPGGDEILDPNSIAMICVTHIPTNSGIVNPVSEIGKRIEEFNNGKYNDCSRDASRTWARLRGVLPPILYLVDACQSVGQLCVDVQNVKCHALTATGRKYLRGPRGTGFLYMKRSVVSVLEPTHIDHVGAPISSVPRTVADFDTSTIVLGSVEGGTGLEDILQFDYRRGASRFEFYESSVSNRLGLGAAIEYALDDVGLIEIESRCVGLGRKLRRMLRKINGVTIYHDEETVEGQRGDGIKRCAIVTFSVRGMDAATVREKMLSGDSTATDFLQSGGIRRRFELSVVPATSTPMDSANTGVGDLVRASLTYVNTMEEIEAFCEKLRSLIIVTNALYICELNECF